MSMSCVSTSSGCNHTKFQRKPKQDQSLKWKIKYGKRRQTKEKSFRGVGEGGDRRERRGNYAGMCTLDSSQAHMDIMGFAKWSYKVAGVSGVPAALWPLSQAVCFFYSLSGEETRVVCCPADNPGQRTTPEGTPSLKKTKRLKIALALRSKFFERKKFYPK